MKNAPRHFSIRWFLPLLLGVAVGAFVLWQGRDGTLTQIVRAGIERKYPQFEVEIGSVQLVEMRGIRLHSLKFYEPLSGGARRLAWECEESFIETPITLAALLEGKGTAQKILLRRPTVYLRYDSPDWVADLAKLKPLRDENDPFFPIEVSQGAFVLTSGGRGSTPLIFSGLDAMVLPPGFLESSPGTSVSVGIEGLAANDSPKTAAAPLLLAPPSTEPTDVWRIEAKFRNPYADQIRLKARLLPDASDWQVVGGAESLRISPELIRGLKGMISIPEPLGTLSGETGFQFQVKKEASRAAGFEYELAGTLVDGGMKLAILEHPLADVFIRYRISSDGVAIERLTGRSGPVLLLADFSQKGGQGGTVGADALLRAKLESFPLTEQTVATILPYLPNRMAEPIRERVEGATFSTTATLRLDLGLTAGEWSPKKFDFQCKNLAIRSPKWPVEFDRLDGGGTLDEGGHLTFRFESQDEARPISAEGDFTDALTVPVGAVRLVATAMPIDEKLLRKLPEQSSAELTALRPSGLFDAQLVYSPGGKNVPAKTDFSLGVRNGSIRYERFPFLVANISGLIQYRDGVWLFTNFRGSQGAATFQAEGGIDAESTFRLNISAARFPLGEDLLNGLVAPYHRELIEKLHLRGRTDANVQIEYRPSEPENQRFNLEFLARPIPELTSIHPGAFPYELRELSGEIHYRNERVEMRGLSGRNGPMTFRADGHCRFTPGGEWGIDLAPFSVDQLQLDHQFQSVVPSRLVDFLESLKLSGFFNVAGAIGFRKATADAPVEGVWDLGVVFNQNRIELGRPVESLCGRAKIRGLAVENCLPQVHAELDLDSLCIGDAQITRLTGPVWFDGSRLLFGNTVPNTETLPLYQNEFLRSRLLAETPSRSAATLPESSRLVPTVRSQMGDILPVGYSASAMTGVPSVSSASSDTRVTSPAVWTGNSTEMSTDPYAPLRIAPNPNPSVSSPGLYGGNPITSGVRPQPPVGFPNPFADPAPSLTALAGAESTFSRGRPLTGTLFHGNIILNGTAFLLPQFSYQAGVMLKEANFNELVRDLSATPRRLNGRVTAYANLFNEGRNPATLKGNGGIVLRDVALYELPPIVKMLQVLSIKEPDRPAFDSSYIDFGVYGTKLCLERVILEGDSLSLFGNGWLFMDGREQRIDLTMNSRLGNSKTQIPLVSDVLGGAQDQIAQIKIEGPLADPSVRQERFPGFKKAWWSVFSDSDLPPATDPSSKESKDSKEKKKLFGRK